MKRPLMLFALLCGRLIADPADDLIQDIQAKFHSHAHAKEFDPILAKLGQLEVDNAVSAVPDRAGYPSAKDPKLGLKIWVAKSFVTAWQMYVFYTETNNEQGQREALGMLSQASMMNGFQIVPRTEILAITSRINAPNANQPAKLDSAVLAKYTDRLANALDSAATPQDLDSFIQDVAKAKQDAGYNSPIASLDTFLKKYQDYLGALQGSRFSEARQDLQMILNDSFAEAYYPRSKLIEKYNELPLETSYGRPTVVASYLPAKPATPAQASFEGKDKSIPAAIREICTRFQLGLTYPDTLQGNVTYHLSGVTASEALKTVLAGTNHTFTITNGMVQVTPIPATN
jgi:hypothetical protein